MDAKIDANKNDDDNAKKNLAKVAITNDEKTNQAIGANTKRDYKEALGLEVSEVFCSSMEEFAEQKSVALSPFRGLRKKMEDIRIVQEARGIDVSLLVTSAIQGQRASWLPSNRPHDLYDLTAEAVAVGVEEYKNMSLVLTGLQMGDFATVLRAYESIDGHLCVVTCVTHGVAIFARVEGYEGSIDSAGNFIANYGLSTDSPSPILDAVIHLETLAIVSDKIDGLVSFLNQDAVAPAEILDLQNISEAFPFKRKMHHTMALSTANDDYSKTRDFYSSIKVFGLVTLDLKDGTVGATYRQSANRNGFVPTWRIIVPLDDAHSLPRSKGRKAITMCGVQVVKYYDALIFLNTNRKLYCDSDGFMDIQIATLTDSSGTETVNWIQFNLESIRPRLESLRIQVDAQQVASARARYNDPQPRTYLDRVGI